MVLTGRLPPGVGKSHSNKAKGCGQARKVQAVEQWSQPGKSMGQRFLGLGSVPHQRMALGEVSPSLGTSFPLFKTGYSYLPHKAV